MSVAEIVAAEQWIYAQLTADTPLMALMTGGVWRNLAPANTPPPYCIFQKQSGRDVSTVAGIRIMDNLLYTVKCVGLKTTYVATLAAAAAYVDADLHRKSGTVTGASIFACTRQEPFSLDELVAGIEYTHLGGTYRLFVQSS